MFKKKMSLIACDVKFCSFSQRVPIILQTTVTLLENALGFLLCVNAVVFVGAEFSPSSVETTFTDPSEYHWLVMDNAFILFYIFKILFIYYPFMVTFNVVVPPANKFVPVITSVMDGSYK